MKEFGHEVDLTTVCDTITYGYTASATDEDTGVKFLRITDIVPDRINWETVPFCLINEKDVEKYQLNIGDIVVARTGATTGWNKTIKHLNHKAVYASFLIKYSVDRSIADPNYVGYNLQSSNWYDYVEAIAGGSAQPGANAKQLGSFKFLLPPLPEQKAIASVLSSLDDKIDLLHRQNKTLEAMAETLFRQWFIEEAKEDWEDGTLDQLIDLKYGKALKQEDRSGSGYPVVASSGIVGFHNNYLVKGPSIVIGRKGTLGKVYFMEDNFYPIDTSYFIQTKTSGSNLIFEYYLLKSLDFANMNSDSAVPGLNRNIALGTQIQVPPEELILSFNGTAQPWFSKIHSNTKQIQTLEKLRDTLLPKLMSGEVRVQYQTEEVA